MTEHPNELKAIRDAAELIKKFCSSMEICNDCFFWEYCRGYFEYDDSLADIMFDLETSINVKLNETSAGGNEE